MQKPIQKKGFLLSVFPVNTTRLFQNHYAGDFTHHTLYVISDEKVVMPASMTNI